MSDSYLGVQNIVLVSANCFRKTLCAKESNAKRNDNFATKLLSTENGYSKSYIHWKTVIVLKFYLVTYKE